jgi:hypothetical protein
MADRPKGVTVVAVLTLLGAIGNFFFTMLLAALGSVGGPPPSGYRPSILFLILVYSPLFLSLFSFIVSSGYSQQQGTLGTYQLSYGYPQPHIIAT